MSVREDAKRNLELAGLFDKDSDYNGMIGKAVMKLVDVHCNEGHSGFSHGLTIHVFNEVIKGHALTRKFYDEQKEKATKIWTENGEKPEGERYENFIRECCGEQPPEPAEAKDE